MCFPVYSLSKIDAGFRPSTIAPNRRIRTGIQPGDTADTTEINVALGPADLGKKVDVTTTWRHAHTMAELTGGSRPLHRPGRGQRRLTVRRVCDAAGGGSHHQRMLSTVRLSAEEPYDTALRASHAEGIDQVGVGVTTGPKKPTPSSGVVLPV